MGINELVLVGTGFVVLLCGLLLFGAAFTEALGRDATLTGRTALWDGLGERGASLSGQLDQLEAPTAVRLFSISITRFWMSLGLTPGILDA